MSGNDNFELFLEISDDSLMIHNYPGTEDVSGLIFAIKADIRDIFGKLTLESKKPNNLIITKIIDSQRFMQSVNRFDEQTKESPTFVLSKEINELNKISKVSYKRHNCVFINVIVISHRES